MSKTICKYNMNLILSNEEMYNITKDEIFNCIILNIDNRRKEIIVKIDDEDYVMTYGNFLTLLICYKIFLKTKCKFSKDFLFDPSDTNEINIFFDNVLNYTLFNLNEQDYDEVKDSITLVISELANVSGEINLLYGNTISIKSLIDLADRNERFKELLYFELPDEDLQFNEIEAFVKNTLNESVEILKEEDNVLQNYLRSGSGINTKQLGQVINIIGSKPDLDGTIIPVPINSSFIRGVDLTSYFIIAKGCRKSLITNSTQVRNSGYLNRKSTLACLDMHTITKGHCDTKHPVKINVATKWILNMLAGRYYKDGDEDKLIRKQDKHLIGQTLEVYSPTTCSCENTVCERCYGSLSKFNNNINIGIVAVLLLTEPLTQRLLSSKHLLTTVSKKIDWSDEFNKYFGVNIDNVYYKNSRIRLKILQEDLIEDEFGDEFSFKKIHVLDKKDDIEIELPIKLNINSRKIDILECYDDELGCYIINGYAEKNIFYYIMENTELSSSLNAIKDMIDKSEYLKQHTIEETINDLLPLIEESGIKIDSVHLELILRCLTIMKDRYKWNKEEVPEYKLYGIKEAILRGNSLAKSLTFEELLKQVSSLEYDIFGKTGSSLLDNLI